MSFESWIAISLSGKCLFEGIMLPLNLSLAVISWIVSHLISKNYKSVELLKLASKKDGKFSPVQSIICLFKECLDVKTYNLVHRSTAQNTEVYSKSWKRKKVWGDKCPQEVGLGTMVFPLEVYFNQESSREDYILKTSLWLTWTSILSPFPISPALQLVI